MYLWYNCAKAQQELGILASPARLAVQDSVRYMRDAHLLDKNRSAGRFKLAVVAVLVIALIIIVLRQML